MIVETVCDSPRVAPQDRLGYILLTIQLAIIAPCHGRLDRSLQGSIFAYSDSRWSGNQCSPTCCAFGLLRLSLH